MGKGLFPKYLKMLSKFSACGVILIVISLTMRPVLAKNASNEDKSNQAITRLSRHMEKMQQKSPQIAEKKKEVEKKLRSGAIRVKKACSHCHIPGQ